MPRSQVLKEAKAGMSGDGGLMPWCHKCQKHLLTPHGAWCHIPFRGMALAPIRKKDSTPSGTNSAYHGEEPESIRAGHARARLALCQPPLSTRLEASNQSNISAS